MKKLFILFFSLAVLVSCSSDDDNVQEEDPIVGTWVLVDASAPFDMVFCENEQSIITLDQNNTGNATIYLTQNDCEPESAPGSWQNNGNSSYTIELPVVGDLTGNVSFSGADEFVFTSQAGPTLTFERQ